ncbi:hypothetical protein [Aliiroseovarius sediminis]|uniref:hypothetical protein n=1 Tax=Aliiroseovarius sediminis TaxID=2925839 RepID=UPI001F597CCE|nr:hypothetical protein [Aliiroseovarius sediminis]MCI2393581.1 hypothetical protein [Aliiroseovarius sediminis]
MTDLITTIDPRGLIRESYRIDGIRIEECRSIFLDWALFDDHEMTQSDRIRALLDHYGTDEPDHPMTQVLGLALEEAKTPKRRGGRKGRVG